IVSIYRFILRFCEKAIRAHFVYVCLGIVFAIKAYPLIESVLQGRTSDFHGDPMPVYCTRSYMLETPAMPKSSATVGAISQLC
ncbi:hypothetical protein PMAYCL1PPCAC_22801, partial [Pristionchus mayeri]